MLWVCGRDVSDMSPSSVSHLFLCVCFFFWVCLFYELVLRAALLDECDPQNQRPNLSTSQVDFVHRSGRWFPVAVDRRR